MYARILAVGAIVAVLSAAPLTASNSRSGCTEAQISVLADFAGSHGEDRPIVSGSLGYYLTDWMQVGGRVTYESVDDPSYWGYGAVYGLGGYVECDWKRWKCFVTPYLALNLTALSEDKNDNVVVFTASPGIKAFLTETIGLSVQANFDFASQGIYNVEVLNYSPHTTAGDKTDISCTFGVRFLFF